MTVKQAELPYKVIMKTETSLTHLARFKYPDDANRFVSDEVKRINNIHPLIEIKTKALILYYNGEKLREEAVRDD